MRINQNTSPCCSSPNIVISVTFHTQGNCTLTKTVVSQENFAVKPKLVTSHLSVCHLIPAHLWVTKIAFKPSQRNSFTQGSDPENWIVSTL